MPNKISVSVKPKMKLYIPIYNVLEYITKSLLRIKENKNPVITPNINKCMKPITKF